MPRIELRCTDSEKELYVQAADGEGLSLSAWIKLACAVRAGGSSAPRREPVRTIPAFNADSKEKAALEHGRRERRPKSGMCEHRVPAGSFCKKCD